MNSEIFERLEGLMKSLMLSVEAGSFTRAEMKAYAAGLELAAQRLKNVFDDLFADTASSSGLSILLSLIGEKPAASPEESRQRIKQAVSAQKRIFKRSEYEDILASFGQENCKILGSELRVDFSGELSRKVLETLSLLRNKFLPCITELNPIGNNGQPFSKWDSLGLRWFELDGLNIDWFALEKL